MNFWFKGYNPHCNDLDAIHLRFKGSNPHCIDYDAMVKSEGSSVSTDRLTISHANAAWLPPSSIPDVLNSYLLHHKCCSSSHAPGPVNPFNMASSRLHFHPQLLRIVV